MKGVKTRGKESLNCMEMNGWHLPLREEAVPGSGEE